MKITPSKESSRTKIETPLFVTIKKWKYSFLHYLNTPEPKSKKYVNSVSSAVFSESTVRLQRDEKIKMTETTMITEAYLLINVSDVAI